MPEGTNQTTGVCSHGIVGRSSYDCAAVTKANITGLPLVRDGIPFAQVVRSDVASRPCDHIMHIGSVHAHCARGQIPGLRISRLSPIVVATIADHRGAQPFRDSLSFGAPGPPARGDEGRTPCVGRDGRRARACFDIGRLLLGSRHLVVVVAHGWRLAPRLGLSFLTPQSHPTAVYSLGSSSSLHPLIMRTPSCKGRASPAHVDFVASQLALAQVLR